MSIIEQGYFDSKKMNTTWSFEDTGRLVISGTGDTDEFAETLSLAEETKRLILDERITEIG